MTRETREAARDAGLPLSKTAARQSMALLDAAQRAPLGKPPKLPRLRKLAVIEGVVAPKS